MARGGGPCNPHHGPVQEKPEQRWLRSCGQSPAMIPQAWNLRNFLPRLSGRQGEKEKQRLTLDSLRPASIPQRWGMPAGWGALVGGLCFGGSLLAAPSPPSYLLQSSCRAVAVVSEENSSVPQFPHGSKHPW